VRRRLSVSNSPSGRPLFTIRETDINIAPDGIWSGKVIYHAVNQHAMISDVSCRLELISVFSHRYSPLELQEETYSNLQPP
jgi:hypothetical protein